MISIIVPVYNVEKYLYRCLNSIRHQTYRELEVIMVDDGSTDGSKAICQVFENLDSRFRLVEKTNGGVSSARNMGIQVAKGEWIGFVDSDDYIESNMFELLLKNAQDHQANISCCGIKAVDESGNTRSYLQANDDSTPVVYNQEETIIQFYNIGHRSFAWSPWNKIFAAEIMQNVRFKEDYKYHEDFFFNLECILNVDKVVSQNIGLYYYQTRNDSATHKNKKGIHQFDGFILSNRAIDLVETTGNDKLVGLAKTYSLFVAINTLFSLMRSESGEVLSNQNENFQKCVEYFLNSYRQYSTGLKIKTKIKYAYISIILLKRK